MTGLAECVSEVLGEPAPPLDAARLDEWLKGRNLGLVRPTNPTAFCWPGHWIARLESGAHVVMFGVPSGVVYGTGAGAIVEALLIAPLDLQRGWHEPYAGAVSEGRIEAIVVARAREGASQRVERARVGLGGIEGDRYAAGSGTFSSVDGRGQALTLIDERALHDCSVSPEAARRNLVSSGIELEALIGREFQVGAVRCFGQRLAEPCAHLQRIGEPGMLRALVHRGGIRADVIEPGEIAVGDPVRAV